MFHSRLLAWATSLTAEALNGALCMYHVGLVKTSIERQKQKNSLGNIRVSQEQAGSSSRKETGSVGLGIRLTVGDYEKLQLRDATSKRRQNRQKSENTSTKLKLEENNTKDRKLVVRGVGPRLSESTTPTKYETKAHYTFFDTLSCQDPAID
ncbi:uncharacterized protein LY89DRAFT_359221 [Mollisia scopiformis]|uniref:Uncharacterized protein n=1 Tax=Mollisia scopiformis TaxID=149040 RepID=A0A132B5A7_MOLSC|nr:uncharacterized protein LY89DRAFT_359221 [Mollisia scopiformis]KUJ07598.1 hypothetical protein LY89DRAFT_359221 [Mollisia scopiformis]